MPHSSVVQYFPIYISVAFGSIAIIAVVFSTLRHFQIGKSIQTAEVKIVSRRSKVVSRGYNYGARTTYYITAEYEDGKRREFRVPSKKIGFIDEDDTGKLTARGNLMLDFHKTGSATSNREQAQGMAEGKVYCDHCGSILADINTACVSCGARKRKNDK